MSFVVVANSTPSNLNQSLPLAPPGYEDGGLGGIGIEVLYFIFALLALLLLLLFAWLLYFCLKDAATPRECDLPDPCGTTVLNTDAPEEKLDCKVDDPCNPGGGAGAQVDSECGMTRESVNCMCDPPSWSRPQNNNCLPPQNNNCLPPQNNDCLPPQNNDCLPPPNNDCQPPRNRNNNCFPPQPVMQGGTNPSESFMRGNPPDRTNSFNRNTADCRQDYGQTNMLASQCGGNVRVVMKTMYGDRYPDQQEPQIDCREMYLGNNDLPRNSNGDVDVIDLGRMVANSNRYCGTNPVELRTAPQPTQQPPRPAKLFIESYGPVRRPRHAGR